MKQCVAVLIDTVSIQDYIFSSNKLKHNIGASEIVANLYTNFLKGKFSEEEINNWKKAKDTFLEKNDWDIGYVGGGNALLFFKTKQQAKEFIKDYTTSILQVAPGLRTAFGVMENFDVDNFTNSMEVLQKRLFQNKNSYLPKVSVEKQGFTEKCSFSDNPAEFIENDLEEKRYISSIEKAKVIAGNESNLFDYLIGDFQEYQFTKDIDSLCTDDRSYVAIIHIDGNSMGERVKKMTLLREMRDFSKSIEEAVKIALLNTTKKIIKELSGNYDYVKINNKKIVPFRPIIAAGDDITIISDAKIALFLTENILKELLDVKLSDNEPIYATGGIAFVKSKFPFHKGYKLAEEVCNQAKTKSRSLKNSVLDFLIFKNSFSSSLEFLKEKFFKTNMGNLKFGPYRILDKSSIQSISKLKKTIKVLRSESKNKIMELRQKLFGNSEELRSFIENYINLPQYKDYDFHIKGYDDNKTPYFDAIELQNFYDDYLLRGDDDE